MNWSGKISNADTSYQNIKNIILKTQSVNAQHIYWYIYTFIHSYIQNDFIFLQALLHWIITEKLHINRIKTKSNVRVSSSTSDVKGQISKFSYTQTAFCWKVNVIKHHKNTEAHSLASMVLFILIQFFAMSFFLVVEHQSYSLFSTQKSVPYENVVENVGYFIHRWYTYMYIYTTFNVWFTM